MISESMLNVAVMSVVQNSITFAYLTVKAARIKKNWVNFSLDASDERQLSLPFFMSENMGFDRLEF